MAALFLVASAGALALAVSRGTFPAALAAIPLAFGAGAVGPLIAASMMEAGGEHERGLVIGTLMSIEGLGAVAGPALVATVTGLRSPRAGVATIEIMFLVLVPLSVLAWRESQRS
jgi:hypothetical protein